MYVWRIFRQIVVNQRHKQRPVGLIINGARGRNRTGTEHSSKGF